MTIEGDERKKKVVKIQLRCSEPERVAWRVQAALEGYKNLSEMIREKLKPEDDNNESTV